MSGLKYRPEIDGLRAIAVIPVILFHMGLNWLPGGYIGVDVFFVISGFLITSIIKKELEEGVFSFRNFWARRVRRILPAIIFVSAWTLAVTYFFVFQPDQQAIGKQALAALLSVANIYFWRSTGDYWGTAAEESPLLHTWSLSVEEQFYLFFPIVMWLIFRFRLRWLQGSIAAAAIGSLALFLWGSQAHPTATFYLLPTRVWELGAGCLLAVSIRNQSSSNSTFGIFAMVGLCMVGLSYLFFDTLNAGLGFAVFGTALIIACGQTGLCNKLLSQRPLVHIGKLSYSLYLWHWPVLVLARPIGVDWPGVSDKVLLVVAIYLLSLGTYHLVEKPTRRRPGVVPPILVCGTAVVSLAIWMMMVPRSYDGDFNKGQFYQNRYTIHPERPPIQPDDQRSLCFDLASREHDTDAFSKGGVISLREEPTPRIVLIGDSLALHWASLIESIAEKHRISTSIYAMENWWPFCNIPPSGDPSFWRYKVEAAMLHYLSQWKPDAVLIGQRWVRDSQKLQECIPLIEWLEKNRISVLLIEMPPEIQVPRGRVAPLHSIYRGITPVANRRVFIHAKEAKFNEIPRELAARYSHVSLVEIEDLYSRDGEALLFDGLDPVYVDKDHLSQHGAMLAFPRLEKAVLEATQ